LDFLRACSATLAIVGISMLVFVALPTRIDRIVCQDSDWASRLLTSIQRFDPSGNCIPSLHVSLTMHACLLAARHQLLSRSWALAIGLVIVLSTVMTKQHLLADAATGGLLTFLIWWVDSACARGSTCAHLGSLEGTTCPATRSGCSVPS
jgi:hypothetical protein